MMKHKTIFVLLLFIMILIHPKALITGYEEWIYLGPHSASIDVEVIGLDPHDSSVIYAGTLYDGWRSPDRGMTWSQLSPAGSQRSIVFDPIDPDIVYVLAYYHLYKSDDSGVTWADLSSSIIANEIVHDPQSSNTLYAARWPAGGSYPGGFDKTIDGGLKWNSIGLSDYDISGLTIDASDPDSIYATAQGVGIFKTIDGGTNWDPISSSDISKIFIDPNSPLILYGFSIWNPTGVFKSIDGGQTWNPINDGLTNLGVRALAIDPVTSTTLYAGTQGGGVFLSTNSGQNWTPINNGLTNLNVQSLAISATFPKVLYAGTSEGTCRLGIGNLAERKVDFNGDGQEDILWRYYGSGGLNVVWFLGDAGSGAPEMLGSPLSASSAARNQTPERTPRVIFSDPREEGIIETRQEGITLRDPRDFWGGIPR